jgi:hypothetical protein
MYRNLSSNLLAPFYLMKKCATVLRMPSSGPFKGIDRPFGWKVESIVIRSVLVNWRLGYFFISHFKGPSSQVQKKPLDAAQ